MNPMKVQIKNSKTKAALSHNVQTLFEELKVDLETRITSGFFHCPDHNEYSQLNESITAAKEIPSHITDCVFLGIGGSSLGPIALIDALENRAPSKIQFHFFENPDPMDWTRRTRNINWKNTLVTVVTKSGTTYETLGLFMLAYDALKNAVGSEQAAKQTIAITDPEKGELLKFAKKEGIRTLKIHPTVGGRFSVFTPVGLFAGALAGFDMSAFLSGAAQMKKDLLDSGHPLHQAFLNLAQFAVENEKNLTTHVLMPYTQSLRYISNWWVQLWAESLGKSGRGFNAQPALGAIDQHSLLQLLRDGPNDKWIGFIHLNQFHVDHTFPRIGFSEGTFGLLEGKKVSDLLTIEAKAIEKVMESQGKSHFTIELSEASEAGLGALLFWFSMMTAFTGKLMGLNPFDQPGVEEGKIYIRENLSKI